MALLENTYLKQAKYLYHILKKNQLAAKRPDRGVMLGDWGLVTGDWVTGDWVNYLPYFLLTPDS